MNLDSFTWDSFNIGSVPYSEWLKPEIDWGSSGQKATHVVCVSGAQSGMRE